MKTFITFIALLFSSIFMNAQQSIEGLWDTGKENTIIEIKKTAGKIFSSDNTQATKGKLMIKEIKKTNNTFKGKLYIIRKNRWVDAVFVPSGNSLTVIISAGIKSKTLKWKLFKKS